MKNEQINLILNVIQLKCSVNVDKFIYNQDEIKEIKRIIKIMSKNIFIDKTYVHFKKTKWKDAFIKEKSWNKLCKLIIDTNFVENASEYEERFIIESISILALTYLYQILCKYGYDVQYIDLSIKQNSEFKVIYEIDERKTWDN